MFYLKKTKRESGRERDPIQLHRSLIFLFRSASTDNLVNWFYSFRSKEVDRHYSSINKFVCTCWLSCRLFVLLSANWNNQEREREINGGIEWRNMRMIHILRCKLSSLLFLSLSFQMINLYFVAVANKVICWIWIFVHSSNHRVFISLSLSLSLSLLTIHRREREREE